MNHKHLTAILVDDEKTNIENLHALLSTYCPEIQVVASAVTVASAYECIISHSPAVVFLDIQMKKETGFDLLRKFDSIHFEVIFVTAFDLYGIQAVKFSALDYLLKPIDIPELKEAVSKLIHKRGKQQQKAQIENLKTQLEYPAEQAYHKVALPSATETLLVKPADILYCRSDNSYTTFYFSDGREKLICKSIKDYEMLLEPYGFLRVHQSYLVNLHFVNGYSKKDGMHLMLKGDSLIPVSKNKRAMVLKAVMK
jgi:two-component system LytT family response regulator